MLTATGTNEHPDAERDHPRAALATRASFI